MFQPAQRTRSSTIGALAALIVAVAYPFLSGGELQLRILTVAFLFAALTISISVSLGMAGLFNMSQGTFFGIGAYTTAILSAEHGLSWLTATAVAIVVSAFAGLILGLSSMRVRGDYWAVVSLAFTVAMFELMKNSKGITGGMDGYFGAPPLTLFGQELTSSLSLYFVTLGIAVICYLAVRAVSSGYLGRALRAVGRDETAATMMGIRPGMYKMLAMAVSSGLAGLAGAGLVAASPFVHPSSFDLMPSFNITIFAVVGGTGNPLAGGLAAILFTFVTEEFRTLSSYQLMISGGVLILTIFLRARVLRVPRMTGLKRWRRD